MYVPRHFAVGDAELLRDFMRANPFATLVTARGEDVRVSHVPFLVAREGDPVLRGHVARANPQIEHLSSGTALAIFVGPHGYVSPSLYTSPESVPTWNYGAVHVSGPVALLDDAALDAILSELVDEHESAREGRGLGRFAYALSPAAHAAKRKAIQGFEIRPEQVQGKMKVSQNRTPDEQKRVIEDFERDSAGRELGALMRRVLGLF